MNLIPPKVRLIFRRCLTVSHQIYVFAVFFKGRTEKRTPNSRKNTQTIVKIIILGPPGILNRIYPKWTQARQNRPWVPHAGEQDDGSLHKLPQITPSYPFHVTWPRVQHHMRCPSPDDSVRFYQHELTPASSPKIDVTRKGYMA